MNIPDREQVVAFLMSIYQGVFAIVFVIAFFTIAFIIWHLIPKKEY